MERTGKIRADQDGEISILRGSGVAMPVNGNYRIVAILFSIVTRPPGHMQKCGYGRRNCGEVFQFGFKIRRLTVHNDARHSTLTPTSTELLCTVS
jgi:hypothetical protein